MASSGRPLVAADRAQPVLLRRLSLAADRLRLRPVFFRNERVQRRPLQRIAKLYRRRQQFRFSADAGQYVSLRVLVARHRFSRADRRGGHDQRNEAHAILFQVRGLLPRHGAGSGRGAAVDVSVRSGSRGAVEHAARRARAADVAMAAKFLADDPAHYRDDDVAGVRGTVILYLASLQGVNHELYEASAIDGAGIRKRLRHITIPQISHIIGIMFILQIIGVFQVLYEPLTMTEGGPNNASMSLMLTSYHYAFRYFEAGRSLAVGVITFVILAALTAVYFRINKRSNED
ncbi:sugar ABC transporter permease [Cohnella algarum]|uniref:carbohydrate ABC transporter permease n=1 Tax=Cohnella algarum TaxID=2044859 RepID=UPI00308465EA